MDVDCVLPWAFPEGVANGSVSVPVSLKVELLLYSRRSW